jgi:hypothetical protein
MMRLSGVRYGGVGVGLVCLGLASGVSVGEPIFSGVHYWMAISSHSIATGDIDGDGVMDIAFNDYSLNRVGYCFGRRDGTFGAAVYIESLAAPFGVELGDMNNDGHVDLMVSLLQGDEDLAIWLGDGQGGFGDRIPLFQYFTNRFGVLDADGDGDLDLFSAQHDDAYVYYNDGSLGFSEPVRFETGDDSRGFDWGDVNGDGALDFVTANYESGDVTLMLSDGAGGFGEEIDFASGDGTSGVVVVDYDGDGDADIVACNALENTVSLIRNMGAAGFFGPVQLPTGAFPTGVMATDLGRDGVMDLIVTSSAESRFDVLRGNGSGGFLLFESYAVPTPIYDAELVDLDCDTIEDLLYIGQNLGYVGASFGQEDGSFSPLRSYTIREEPEAIDSGDFNGDGIDDFAVGYDAAELLEIFLCDADGTPRLAHSFELGQVPNRIVVRDMDGDGRQDLLVSLLTLPDEPKILVYSGRGDGGFDLSAELYGEHIARDLSAGDVDGDGLVDVIAPWFGPGQMAVWYADGVLAYGEPVVLETGARPDGIAVGDLDGDGYDDVVVPSLFDWKVQTFMGSPTGLVGVTFEMELPGRPNEVGLVDLNGNGRLDLLIGFDNWDAIATAYGNGLGQFTPSGRHVSALNVFGFEASDFDLDGHADLLVWRRNTLTFDQHFEVHLGLGDGRFDAPMLLDTGGGFRSWAVGDIDGNGYADILTLDPDFDLLRIHPNRTGESGCAVDLDSDGELNLADVQLFVDYLLAGDLCGDFSGDGVMNFFDIGAFIAAYQAGCD